VWVFISDFVCVCLLMQEHVCESMHVHGQWLTLTFSSTRKRLHESLSMLSLATLLKLNSEGH
jgi:hypothetical protein